MEKLDYTQYQIRWMPEYSEWRCYLFGESGCGMLYIPPKGKEPNWFWRKMQYLCLGHRWVKNEKVAN